MTSLDSFFEIVRGPGLFSLILALVTQSPITFTIKVSTGATHPAHSVLQGILVTNLTSIGIESGAKDENGLRFNWNLTGFFRFPSDTGEPLPPTDTDTHTPFRAYYSTRERHGTFILK